MQRIHQELAELVKEALRLLRTRQAQWRTEISEVKGAGDIATQADLEAEDLVIRRLERILPGVPVLSEERGRGQGAGDQLLVIDPLDGTHNYHRGMNHYAVSIALLDNGYPEVAAAAVGAAMEIYSAERNQGAYLDGRRLVLSPEPLHPLSLVALPSAIPGETMPDYWGWLYSKGFKVRNYGSAVSHLCQVAAGRFDLALLQKTKVWDFAGAGLIVQEAGGFLADFSGAPIYPVRDSEGVNYRLVASNGAAHQSFPQELLV